MELFFILLFAITAFVLLNVEHESKVGESKSQGDKYSSLSKDEMTVLKTYATMAKLTPYFHSNVSLVYNIKDCVKISLTNISQTGGISDIYDAILKYDELSIYGMIKVKDLQKELVNLRKRDFSFKKEFVIGLLAIAYIDDKLDENQEKLLLMVIDTIGLKRSVYGKLQTMYFNRKASGRYDIDEYKKEFISLSTNEMLVVEAYAAMAKLTPNINDLPRLKNHICECAETGFREIADVDVRMSIEDMCKNFTTFLEPGQTIKVKDLQNELVRFKTKDFPFKKEFIIGLWGIAYLNGNFDDNQEKLLLMVKDAIGMKDAVYYKVQTMFWNRMRAGKFGDYEEFEKRRAAWYKYDAERKSGKNNQKRQNQEEQDQNKNKEKSDRNTHKPHLSWELEKAYTVLELLPDASVEEVRSQKRILLKKYHPDLFANQGDKAVAEATKKAQIINQAFDLIMKEKR